MKKEDTNKKKKRLLLALFMLVISGVALTTATYAWFSANTVVTTSDIDVKVTAATGISISADALNFDKEISMTDVINFAKERGTNSTLQMPEQLNPVSTAGIVGANTDYTFVRGMLGENSSVVALENSTVNTTLGTDEEGNPTFTGGDYLAFDIYIKSSQDLDLKLASTTSISALDAASGTGNLESGLRMGFLPLGASTDTSTTGQQSSALALNKVQTDWKIWNPAPTLHHASTLSGYADGESELSKGYYAANQATNEVEGLNTNGETATDEEKAANANHYVKYLHKDVDGTTPAYLTLMDSTNAHYIQNPDADNTYSGNVFKVKAGINKVRIYVWLEGNDVDCVDAISISNGLKIALGFEVVGSETGA